MRYTAPLPLARPDSRVAPPGPLPIGPAGSTTDIDVISVDTDGTGIGREGSGDTAGEPGRSSPRPVSAAA